MGRPRKKDAIKKKHRVKCRIIVYCIAPVILQYALLPLRCAEPTRAESIFFDSARVGSAHLKGNPSTQHEPYKLDFG